MADTFFEIVHKIKIRGLNIAYRVVPSTNAEFTEGVVFLLHGFMDHSATWRRIIQKLPKTFIYIAFDFRGHGDSDWMPQNSASYYEYDFVLDAFTFIRLILGEISAQYGDVTKNKYLLGQQPGFRKKMADLKTILMGHSFGGNVSLKVAQIGRIAKQFEKMVDAVISIESDLLTGRTPVEFVDLYFGEFRNAIEKGLNFLNNSKKFDSEEEIIKIYAAKHLSNNLDVATEILKHNIKRNNGKYSLKFDPRLSFNFFPSATPQSLAAELIKFVDFPFLIISTTKGLIFGKKWRKEKDFIRKNASNIRCIKMVSLEGGHHCHMEENGVGKIPKLFKNFVDQF